MNDGANPRTEMFAAQLAAHFDERVRIYGAGLKSVDWKSAEAQYNRFHQLLKVVDFSRPFSLNDYGSGSGELINLLRTTGAKFDYFGFDISSQMVEKARETFADYTNCRFSGRIEDVPVADYTVASGVFSLKFAASDDDWKSYMLEKVAEINRLSRKGFAFNALTSYSDIEFRRDHLYYADPLFWFDHCKRNFSRFVSLRHDYPEYDWTIIVRKEI